MCEYGCGVCVGWHGYVGGVVCVRVWVWFVGWHGCGVAWVCGWCVVCEVWMCGV